MPIVRFTQNILQSRNCWDNACVESFFGTLKSECFHRQEFASVKDLEITIKEYIDYYNNDRIKVKLDGLSPIQYRNKYFKNR
ncbi:integrase core domain-containing protein [Enhydrobacter aerosaccus]|uniref:IS3 family transposase n=1 Tax=Moraxella sp. CTOTU49803 TaxID=2953840 RepID=UPI00092D2319